MERQQTSMRWTLLLLYALLFASVPRALAQCSKSSISDALSTSDAEVLYDPVTSNATRACFSVSNTRDSCDPYWATCCLGANSKNGAKYQSFTLTNTRTSCSADLTARKFMRWTVNGKQKKPKFFGPDIMVSVGVAGSFSVCVDLLPGLPQDCNTTKRLCRGSKCGVKMQLSKVTKKPDLADKTTWMSNLACCLSGSASLKACDEFSNQGCVSTATCTRYEVEGVVNRDCVCADGYQGDGFDKCTDIDECALGTAECDPVAICTNTPGNYTCKCPRGYIGSGFSCEEGLPLNLCAATCNPNAKCGNISGTPRCACKKGFTGDGVGSCVDIDECATNNGGCLSNAVCTNTVGSRTCACLPGFYGDGVFACTNATVCGVGNNITCHERALCSNDTGRPSCRCKDGYAGDGISFCNRIATCPSPDNPEVDISCHPSAVCSNATGTPTCTCQEGYEGDGVSGCAVIYLCAKGNGGCLASAICAMAAPGIRTCHCKGGFAGDGETNCTDINECATDNGNCDANAVCENTPGGHTCKCKHGYVRDGSICTDMNECASNNGGCSVDANCTNTDGSYTCACKAGFAGDGITCELVDKCIINNGGCHVNATCTKAGANYTCACKPGYEGDGVTNCTDTDECLTANGGCHADAVCTNTDGGRDCACKAGYTGDGIANCTDIDECAAGNGGCSVNATCANTDGGRNCTCMEGFDGDGVTCGAYTSPCETDNGGCNPNAVCNAAPRINKTCACKGGYSGDGSTCSDVNECDTDNGGCDPNAACENTDGGFNCTCHEGYAGSGFACNATEICFIDNGGCDLNANCTHGNGTVSCICKDGYMGNGTSCRRTLSIKLVNVGSVTAYDYLFRTAAYHWEQLILVDLPDFNNTEGDDLTEEELFLAGYDGYFGPVDDVMVFYGVTPIAGLDGPTIHARVIRTRNDLTPISSVVKIDTDRAASQAPSYETILKAIGAALGVGDSKVWTEKGCVATGACNTENGTADPQTSKYLCDGAKAAFTAAGCSGDLKVDGYVVNPDGSGARCSFFWNEAELTYELMTHSNAGNGAYSLSAMTIGALADIYGEANVDSSKADYFAC